MNIRVLTLFTHMVESALSYSITGRALDKGIVDFLAIDIRQFAQNKHNQVDDYPYGGGPGMVMAAPPVVRAYEAAIKGLWGETQVLYLTPQGAPFHQKMAEEFSQCNNLILLCGHYEGVDERAIELIGAKEVSLGDFVLTGGEIAAVAVIDAVLRLLPGVLNKTASHQQDSFSSGLLEYPQYTRPQEYQGKCVPPVLLSGNHGEIERWRSEKALERTAAKRPDLLRGQTSAIASSSACGCSKPPPPEV